MPPRQMRTLRIVPKIRGEFGRLRGWSWTFPHHVGIRSRPRAMIHLDPSGPAGQRLRQSLREPLAFLRRQARVTVHQTVGQGRHLLFAQRLGRTLSHSESLRAITVPIDV